MITLYNNPLCIFHKRPNLWWHYWQLTVASVLWFIPLCISFINQDLLKRHSWELELEFWSWPHKGVHWSSVHCLKKSWLRFSARPSLPPPSLDTQGYIPDFFSVKVKGLFHVKTTLKNSKTLLHLQVIWPLITSTTLSADWTQLEFICYLFSFKTSYYHVY